MSTRPLPMIGTWQRLRFQCLEMLCALAGLLALLQPCVAQEPPPTSTVQVAKFACQTPLATGPGKQAPEDGLREALKKAGMQVPADGAAATYFIDVSVSDMSPKQIQLKARLRRPSDGYGEHLIVSSTSRNLPPATFDNWAAFIAKRLRKLEGGPVVAVAKPAPTPAPQPAVAAASPKPAASDLLQRFPPPPRPVAKTAPARPAGGPLHLAIVTDSTNEAVRAVVDRLNADLSGQPGIALVERQALQRLLEELGGAGTTLRAGELAHADVLVTLRSGPGFVLLRLVDVRRGWVQAARTFAWPGNAQALHDDVLARTRAAVTLAQQPDDRLRPVAVATFLSGDVDRSLDRLQEDLPAVLEESLLRDGSIVPLDRSALMEIVEENALAGGADDLRGATHFVEGRFTSRREAGGVFLHLTVSVHGPGTSGIAWEGDAAAAGLRATLAQAASAVVARVRGGPAAAKADLAADAAQARERADFFWQQGDRHRGLEALESAWLLCPTQDLWYAQIRQWRSELAQGGFQRNETPQQAARRLNLFVQCHEEARQWLALPAASRPPFPHPWVKSAAAERYAGEPGCVAAWMRWSEARLDAARADWRAGAAATGKSPATEYAQQITAAAHLFARMRPTEAQWFAHFPPLLERRIEIGGDPVALNEELGQMLYRLSSNDGGDLNKDTRIRLLDTMAQQTKSPAVARLLRIHAAMIATYAEGQSPPDYRMAGERLKGLLAEVAQGASAAVPMGLNERANLLRVWSGVENATRNAGAESLRRDFIAAATAGGKLGPAAESLAASLCRTREGARFPSGAEWDDLVLFYLASQRADRTFLEQFCAEAARELARVAASPLTQPRLARFRAFADREHIAWAAPVPNAPAAATVATTTAPRFRLEELADFSRYRDPATGEFHMSEPAALLTRHGRLYVCFVNHTAAEFEPATRSWKWLQPIPGGFTVYPPSHLWNEHGSSSLDLSTADDGLFICQAESGIAYFGFNGWSKIIGLQDGVPSNTVHSLAFAGMTGYAGCRGGVARWDRTRKSWDVLFGTRLPADGNPLNGGDPYSVTDIEVDEPGHRLVFTVTGTRAGLWAYDLNTKKAEKLLPITGVRPTRDGDWLFLTEHGRFAAYNLRDPSLSRGFGSGLPAGFRAPPARSATNAPPSNHLPFPAAPLGDDLLFCVNNEGLYRWDAEQTRTTCDVSAPGRCGSLVAWNGGVAASSGYKVFFYSRADAPPPAFTAAPPLLVASPKTAPIAPQAGSLRFVPHPAEVAIRAPFVADGLAGPELDDVIVKRDWSDVREVLSCGPAADLFWCETDLHLQREAGRLLPLAAAHGLSFCDVAWDGRNIWAATTNRGLLVFDSAGNLRAEVDKSGQLPANAGLRICTLTTNRVLVAGGSTHPVMGWCAIVELTAGGPRVDVFHRAERPDTAASPADDSRVAFRPAYAFAWREGGTAPARVLIGRNSDRLELSSRPLVIELATKEVTVAARTMAPARSRHTPSLLEVDGLLVESSAAEVRVFPPFDPQTPPRTLPIDAGALQRVRYDPTIAVGDFNSLVRDEAGAIYVCGQNWFRVDPPGWNVQRMDTKYPPGRNQGDWPAWRTAHLGLIAIHNGVLHRVLLPGEPDRK